MFIVLPLLAPSGPRRIVHSSIVPNGVNSCFTSSSVCCLLSIPTKSFRSVYSIMFHSILAMIKWCTKYTISFEWFANANANANEMEDAHVYFRRFPFRYIIVIVSSSFTAPPTQNRCSSTSSSQFWVWVFVFVCFVRQWFPFVYCVFVQPFKSTSLFCHFIPVLIGSSAHRKRSERMRRI